MKIYDKAFWHIDAGEDKEEVIERMEVVFAILKAKNMLSNEGKEIVELGIDESISLHERLLTPMGNLFMEKYYSSVNTLRISQMVVKLLEL